MGSVSVGASWGDGGAQMLVGARVGGRLGPGRDDERLEGDGLDGVGELGRTNEFPVLRSLRYRTSNTPFLD